MSKTLLLKAKTYDMRITSISLGIIALFLIQCKSANVGQADADMNQVTPMIILLANDLSPADLESVKSAQIESMKRVSRSQNQWMLKVKGDESAVLKVLNELKEDEKVLEVYLDGEKPSDSNRVQKNRIP